jgi:hypothetical protein
MRRVLDLPAVSALAHLATRLTSVPQQYVPIRATGPAGKLHDYEYPAEEIAMALAGLPSVGSE